MTNKKLLPKGNPAFCYIAPVDLLEYTVYSKSPRHLVLAHLILSDDPKAAEYIDFYRERSEAGDYIICDNSAFELGASFDPNKLIEAAKLVKADALVLPDYPGQPIDVTIRSAIEWIPKYKAAGFDTFFVPQSERGDLEGWIESYEWASQQADIDIIGWSILGIPNALPRIPREYARVVMAQILTERGILQQNTKYNHFLGLNSGPNLELPALLKMGILDSCDSSGPIWSATNGVPYSGAYDSFMPVSKKMLPAVDFFSPIDKTTELREVVGHNVAMTESIFRSLDNVFSGSTHQDDFENSGPETWSAIVNEIISEFEDQ